jgi:REP element-mobilizing transposase RayT
MKEPNAGFERVRFALRATGVKPENYNPQCSGIHSRGYLPHVKREGANYFVTFRLADSLPKEVLMKLESRRADQLRQLAAQRDAFERGLTGRAPDDNEQDINRAYHREVERYLDRGAGESYLARPPIAELVARAIQFFEGQRYRVHAWVVMPNHAHAVVWPMPNHLLGNVVGSWKGFTGRKANQMLNRVGQAFWQPEPFDHWIRDNDEKARICRYVINNPVKAKLCKAPEEWRWSSAWPGWKTRPTG